MEVIGRCQVDVHQRVLLVGKAAAAKLAVKTHENSVVESLRETRRRKHDVVGAFAFGTRGGVWQRLKRHQWLNTKPADIPPGPVLDVIGWEAKIFDGPGA